MDDLSLIIGIFRMIDKEKIILKFLREKNIIPNSGIFQISEEMLTSYIQAYHLHFGATDIATGKKNNTKFARRLAGRTLLELNFDNGAKHTEINAGILYLIENPAFPEHYKAGMTINLKQRLAQYQTYDPYRKFKVFKYDFVLDKRRKEKEFLTHPNIYNELGEWVKKTNAEELFSKIIIP